MMDDEALLETAIAWHTRLAAQSATDGDWGEFALWLEADPAHEHAYERIAMADLSYAEALAESPAAPAFVAENDNEPQPWYRRKGLMAMAAGTVLALFSAPLVFGGRDLQVFETKAGESRQIALDDGTQVALNGATRIEIDMKDKRFARLDRGEALFSVRHDPRNPFTLEVDSHRLVDVGTKFNVRQSEDGLEVAVGEGAVRFNPDDEAMLVKAGNQLTVAPHQGKAVLSATDPANVGGWRDGRLAYRDAPLGRIAADLSRLFGERVKVDAAIKGRRFSGLILIDKDREKSMRQVEALLGIRARHGPGGWILTD